MSTNPNKRDIADFFRPYARPVSQKQALNSNDEDSITVIPAARAVPKTPTKSRSFKDITTSSHRGPLTTPRSGKALLMPIRSPFSIKGDETSKALTTRTERSTPKPVTLSTENLEKVFPDISRTRPDQRIARDPTIIEVRDSDEDTDSLESLADILGKKRKDDISSNSSPLDVNEHRAEAERIRLLKTWTQGRPDPIIGKGRIRALLNKDREKQFDLSNILNDHLDDEETEQNVLKARQGYEANVKELEASRQSEVDRMLLTSIVQGHDTKPEDVARVLGAIERTEVMSSERIFSFLGIHDLGDLPKNDSSYGDFPYSLIPCPTRSQGNPPANSSTLISGYVSELARKSTFPDEVLRWIFENAATEIDASVQHSYTQCLRAGSSEWTRSNLSATDVQLAFRRLGADPNVIRDGSVVRSKRYSRRNVSAEDFDHILTTLEIFSALCQDMDFTALSKLCSVISRLAVDTQIMGNGTVSPAVETLLEKLLNLPDRGSRQHIYDRMMTDLGQNLVEPFLQLQLLNHILPTTALAVKLRKDLALKFLFGSSTSHVLSQKDVKANILDQLAAHITTSPSFRIARTSRESPIDYAALTSLTHILDAAIADGDRPPPNSSSTTLKVFNASVDQLADKIHSLFVSIADSGATHMRRTEAKDALQALHFRLLYAVRTKPRKKKHIFDVNMHGTTEEIVGLDGEEWRSENRGKDFMQRFLKRGDDDAQLQRELRASVHPMKDVDSVMD